MSLHDSVLARSGAARRPTFGASAAFATLALSLSACGGRSTLTEYKNGVGAIFPEFGDAGPSAPPGNGGPGDSGTVDGGGSSNGGDAAPSSASPGAVGSACDKPSDCDGPSADCLTSVPVMGFTVKFPGGYCTTTGCKNDDDCPDNSACTTNSGKSGCQALCTSDNDCRKDEKYTCGTIPLSTDGRKYCLPPLF